MKGRLVAFVGVFCIASLIASGVSAKGKPDNPGKGKPKGELIVFSGEGLPEGVLADLTGSEIVEDCCPNAGPFPEYTMTLSGEAFQGLGLQGEYVGQLFMNGYGAGQDAEYLVQFWVWPEDPDPDNCICIDNPESCFWIEIIGGVDDYDKKTKTSTVTFVETLGLVLLGPLGPEEEPQEFHVFMDFTLVRSRS